MPIDHQGIRVLALALIKHRGKFLACAGFDHVKKQSHYRLLGGGVEFGESCRRALSREIKEELGLTIAKASLLAVEENIFSFNGLPGHEVVFLYAVELRSQRAYQRDSFPILDSDRGHVAEWVSPSDLKNKKLYPLIAKKYL